MRPAQPTPYTSGVALVGVLPSGAQQHQPDQAIAGQRVPDHGAVTVLEDVKRQEDAGEQDDVGEREDRDRGWQHGSRCVDSQDSR